MKTEQELFDEFAAWCAAQGLPVQKSAEDLIRAGVTEEQREWLIDFIDRYEAMMYREPAPIEPAVAARSANLTF
jgi:hypothetical protein